MRKRATKTTKTTKATVTLPLEQYEKMRDDIEDMSAAIDALRERNEILDSNLSLSVKALEEVKDKYAMLMASVKHQEARW